MSKIPKYTAVIDGQYAGFHHTQQGALDSARPIIKPGETLKLYYEDPYSHLIGEMTYDEVQQATR